MFADNIALAKIFRDLSLLYQVSTPGNKFRALAYGKVSNVLLRLQRDIREYYNEGSMEEIEGVGESIALKISEYLETGKISKFESMKKKFPPELLELIQIRNVGPQTIKRLYYEFHVTNKKEFIEFLSRVRIKKVKGFGRKKAEMILRSLNELDQTTVRMSLQEASLLAAAWIGVISPVAGVERVEVAGSVRRERPTIGDIDIVIAAEKKYHSSIIGKLAGHQNVKEILAKGSTKMSFIDRISKHQVDIRIVEPLAWGAALLYFTGSKEHTIQLRELAKQKKFKLNEYGLFDKKNVLLASRTEKEIYAMLGVNWIPPQEREGIVKINPLSISAA